MKSRFSINILALLFLLLIGTISCKEKEEPANVKPTCNITSPENNQEFISKDTIIITVDAFDEDGVINEVIFFVNGEALLIDYEAPYSYEWLIDDESSGDHTIIATCHDDNGGSNSDEISISIIHNLDAPLADFFATNVSGQGPLFTHFFDKSTNDPTSWEWDFGDGNTSTAMNPYYTYHQIGSFTVTLKATNAFGEDSKTVVDYITTLPGGHIAPFTDPRDGQIYDSIQIGNQTWMAANLNFDCGEGCWNYDDDEFIASTFGKLYNYQSAKNACPDGWHLPSDGEWRTLERYIGMSESESNQIGWRGTTEGGDLKLSGMQYWEPPNHGATNSAHFYALPGGQYFNGYSGDMFFEAYFWTASLNGLTQGYYRKLRYDSPQIGRSDVGDVEYGFSVRCVKTVP